MVEEFMLLGESHALCLLLRFVWSLSCLSACVCVTANVAVAKHTLKTFPTFACLR